MAVILCISIAAVTLQVASEKKKLGKFLLKMRRAFRYAVHKGFLVMDTMKTWSSSQVSNSSRFRFNLASHEETDTAFSFAMKKKVVIMEISSHHSMHSSSVHDTQRLEYMDDEDGIPHILLTAMKEQLLCGWRIYLTHVDIRFYYR